MQLLDKDGNVIDKWKSTKKKHTVTNLKAGDYVLKETAAPTGYVIATDISFSVDEYGVVTVNGVEATASDDSGNPTIVMVDDTTKTSITKKDISGDKEVEGAEMKLFDKDGNIVEEWTSTDKAHEITGKLKAGDKYTLHEESAPDGYVVAADIEFTVSETGEIDAVTMKDDTTKVHITKTDITGEKEIEGAKLQLIDENGNIVDEWVSISEAHIIEGKLIAGKEYTLHEEICPDGYVVANDITFKVSENGDVDIVNMKDDTTKVRISKKDITAQNELPGATLQIIDENGNVVEEWVSTNEPHYVEGKLIAGKTYTLREITAPDGYEIANDVKFTVDEKGNITQVVMYDEHTPTTPPPSTPPKTGAERSESGMACALAALAIGAILLVAIRKKEK